MRHLLCIVLLIGSAASPAGAASPPEEDGNLRVMSFNLWVGGEAGGQPLEDSAAVIRKSGADIVGLQETHGTAVDGKQTDNGPAIANMLGWNYIAQPGRRGIMSRFDIVRLSRGKQGALIHLPGQGEAWIFNVHLPAAPYQPYQLVGIKYAEGTVFIKTEDEAIAWAKSSRGKQVDELLADMKAEQALDKLTFVTGDFNEPSPQDWTADAVKAGLCPVSVAWPSVKAVLDLGFVDAYRRVHPDPVKQPGHTWTPTTDPKDPKDRHDRIDFVLVSPAVETGIRDAKVVGEKPSAADMVIEPWPSDHRAVLATVCVPSE